MIIMNNTRITRNNSQCNLTPVTHGNGKKTWKQKDMNTNRKLKLTIYKDQTNF